MGVPSLPIRNFSKFQAMSVLLTGFQIKKWGLKHFWGQSQDEGFAYLAIRLSESSEGAGSDFLRNVKRGCSFSPFTSTCPNVDDFYKKIKRYLAPQTSTLGLKRYKMVKRKIGESGLPCRTCPPWTRSHCRASHASAGWRSPHRRRSPVQHRLRSNLSSTNPDVGSSHQNRIMLLSWYWKARVWFLSILVTWYRSRSSRCHLI